MMDFNTVEKKLDLIRTKYELSSYSTKTLAAIYNREDLYYELLSRLETIMVLDSDFILLGNHMDKYREIINYGRFQYHTKGKIRDYENLTLTALNSQEQTKEEYRKKYLMEQLKLRLQLNSRKRNKFFSEKGVNSIDKMICGLSEFDYVFLSIINQIKNGVAVSAKDPAIKYLSSMSYLLKNAKEIFYQDREYCDATLNIIDIFKDKHLIPSDYHVGKIKRKLNSIKNKR